MTYYIVYETTNTVNDKKYVGIHQTESLNDGYLGSGKLLLRALKKYGKPNFVRKVLWVFDNEEDMINKEVEIVTEEFCNRSNTYNIMSGGKWGSATRNNLTFKNRYHSEETKLKQRTSSKILHGVGVLKSFAIANNFATLYPSRQKEHARKAGALGGSKTGKRVVSAAKFLLAQERARVLGYKNKGLIRKRFKCPHCEKEGAMNTMNRFHFDNCKYLALKSTGSDTTL